MNVVVRADSSSDIGIGHIMRCLALAEAMHAKGTNVSFICRDFAGNIADYIASKGFRVDMLATPTQQFTNASTLRHASWLGVDMRQDVEETLDILNKQPAVDWLIVDHYALDEKWQQRVREKSNKIAVIDDLADRRHDCDLLLDQNLSENMHVRYDALVPGQCRKLIGPEFALLRPEFSLARGRLRQRDGIVKKILVFFGGADPTDETSKTLDALQNIVTPEIKVLVVVGGGNRRWESIKERCAAFPQMTFFRQIDNMADLMVEADLAIGAGGSTTWERCCLGLPSLVVTIAMNQVQLTVEAAKSGAAVYAGEAEQLTPTELADSIRSLIFDPTKLVEMSVAGMRLVDGCGTARVLEAMAAIK